MQLTEITCTAAPTCIGLHDADGLVAVAVNHRSGYGEHSWVDLGEMVEGRFTPRINLFLHGPDAAAKAERLAIAINAAMAGDTALRIAAE